MTNIFPTQQQSLLDFLNSELPAKDLQTLAGNDVFLRGKDYFKKSSVKDVTIEDRDKITAKVLGTVRYNLALQLKKGYVQSKCSCPFEGAVCKHLVALLLWIKENPLPPEAGEVVEFTEVKTTPDEFKKYVDGLNREELVKLVMKFAPESFRNKIVLKAALNTPATGLTPAQQLEQVSAAIGQLFKKGRLVEAPEAFLKKLVKPLDQLKPLWGTHPNNLHILLLDILERINNTFREAEFRREYDPSYGDDTDWSPLTDYMISFVSQVKGDDKFEFVNELHEKLMDMEYTALIDVEPIYSDKVFTKAEYPALKDYFFRQLIAGNARNVNAYHTLLKSSFSAQEEFDFLKFTSKDDSSKMLDLIDLLGRKGDVKKAYELVEKFIQENSYADPIKKMIQLEKGYFISQSIYSAYLKSAYQKYIELAKKLDMNAATAAQQALQHIQSRDMFNFIVKELPEEKAYFEGLFQKVNPDEAASYLEETGRLDEAYELIKKRSVTGYLSYPGAGYAFLERHFKRFPADAKQAALMRINNNLQITGEAAYLSVVNAMILLRKVDEAEFKVQFYTIKEKCKRKTNLIKMIDQKLGKYMK